MPRSPLVRDDPDFSVRLRLDLRLSSQFEPVIQEIVTGVHAGSRMRQDTLVATTIATDIILANLLRAFQRNKQLYVSISLNANSYHSGLANPSAVGSRGIRRVVDYLATTRSPLIQRRIGGQFRGPGGQIVGSHLTRIRATDQLIAKLNRMQVRGDTASPSDEADGQSHKNASSFSITELPIIRLKSSEGKLISFRERKVTRAMRDRLERYNEFLNLQSIDLLLPDEEFQLAVTGRNDANPNATDASKDKDRVVDLLFQRKLYRVFNNGRFDHGGRFYGGWWQHIPSNYRKYITINWAPVVELDFSNMQIAMLYAKRGRQLVGDAYSLEGVGQEYRKLIKRTLLALINAEGRIRAPRRRELPRGWTWGEFKEAIQEKHSTIARYFRSGIGIRLQRVDSDIAEDVMMSFMERDVLVLPVHDSFLTYPAQRSDLLDAMQTAYAARMSQHIGIDADPSFIETELSEDAVELDSEGVRSIEDLISEYESAPHFAGYRQRRTDFLVGRSDAWRMRFYTGA